MLPSVEHYRNVRQSARLRQYGGGTRPAVVAPRMRSVAGSGGARTSSTNGRTGGIITRRDDERKTRRPTGCDYRDYHYCYLLLLLL